MEKPLAQKSLMRDRRFWIPVIVSVPATIIFTVISAVTADFGFATYEAAMIFFPYMMLSVLWFGVIHPAIGIASLFQWPLYGVLMADGWRRNRLIMVVEILLLIHITAVVLAVRFVKYSNWQPMIYSTGEVRR
jgi:membrane-associated HD superfamily phosphohydrolase